MEKNIITVKNIKTGEVLEFTGQNAVAKYLTGVYGKKIYAGAVASAIRQEKPYKKTWEINLIEGGDIRVCDYCGKEYKRKNKKQRFCSNYCKEQYIVVQRTKDTPLVAMGDKDKEKLVHKLVTMLAPYRTAK